MQTPNIVMSRDAGSSHLMPERRVIEPSYHSEVSITITSFIWKSVYRYTCGCSCVYVLSSVFRAIISHEIVYFLVVKLK